MKLQSLFNAKHAIDGDCKVVYVSGLVDTPVCAHCGDFAYVSSDFPVLLLPVKWNQHPSEFGPFVVPVCAKCLADMLVKDEIEILEQ